MTEAKKIERVQILLDYDPEATSDIIKVLLQDAEDIILNRMYPFGVPDDAYLPDRYETYQCRLAQRYFLRRGAEGEIVHNENGVNRTYDSVNDEDILRNIIQIAKVIGQCSY